MVTLKLTVWELRGKSKIITKVPRLQIIHLYNLTLTLCIWYYQAVLVLILLVLLLNVTMTLTTSTNQTAFSWLFSERC